MGTESNRDGFENDVKMYGTQTHPWNKRPFTVFENDVKMYGTQTYQRSFQDEMLFENDVKMYGTQTEIQYDILKFCLRMM